MNNPAKWLRRSLCFMAVSVAATVNAQQISMETVASGGDAGVGVPEALSAN
ncbi:MAG: hypothetical protein HWE39_07725 [Oceanospirillaceae bacterium]|nr:hypothetical protein [Oceanospirillaceae bacterium]